MIAIRCSKSVYFLIHEKNNNKEILKILNQSECFCTYHFVSLKFVSLNYNDISQKKNYKSHKTKLKYKK